MLRRINLPVLKKTCSREKEIALQFGQGSLQEFGVMSFQKGRDIVYYSAGRDKSGQRFEQWEGLPGREVSEYTSLFNASEFMGRFYDYSFEEIKPFTAPVLFVSNFKSIHGELWKDIIASKKVWVSGSKTWFELARKGIWVEGSADGLGLESLLKPWAMPVLNYRKSDIHILTNHESRGNWQHKGWKASSTYSLIPKKCPVIEQQVAKADFLFWTSFGQFSLYKNVVSGKAVHACLQGETAVLLEKEGIKPVLFPTIKSFAQWKQNDM